MSRTRCLLLLSLTIAPVAHAATIKVKQDGALATIQAGVDAATAGDTVEVAAGVYQENVVIRSQATGIKLVAKGKVIVDALAAGGAPAGPGVIVDADDVTIEDLTIRHATAVSQNVEGIGVLVTANGFIGRRITTLRCLTSGIRVIGDDVLLDSCSDKGSTDGFEIRNGQHAVVDACTLRQNNGPSISIQSYVDAQVTGCNVILSESNGISAFAADQTQVRGCHFDQTCDFAVSVSGADAVVADNVIERADAGIVVTGDGFLVQHNTIRRLSNFTGIFIDDSTSGTIEDNEIRDFNSVAIDIRSNATGIEVRNNVMTGSLDANRAAIVIEGNGSTIENNQVSDGAGDGISVTGDANLFVANTIEDCVRDGFDFDSSAAANTMTGNIVRRCLAEGLDHDGSNSFVNDNTFEDCRIDVANSGSILSFTGNVFTTGGLTTDPELD